MIASAQVAHYARHAARWGVRTGEVSVDLPRVVTRKDQVVLQWRSGLERKVQQRLSVHLHRGHGRFLDPHRVRVGDQVLESERIFIDTGARPSIPRIQGLDQADYLTNVSIMQVTDLPEHLLVLGGGYVGLEFGQMFRRFGCRVTVVHSAEQILPREDADVARELQQTLEAEGIRFVLKARTTRVEQDSGQVILRLENGDGAESVRGSHLLVATGRRPNTDDLGLETTGVQTTPQGFIRVDSRLETNVPGIWALGDVNGGPAFTHIAYNDYQIVYANLIEGKDLTTVNRLVPYAVFTDPQLGRVGLTEKEARATGRRLKIGKIPMAWVARAVERDETAGLIEVGGRCRNRPDSWGGGPVQRGGRVGADPRVRHARGRPLHAPQGGRVHPPDARRGLLDADRRRQASGLTSGVTRRGKKARNGHKTIYINLNRFVSCCSGFSGKRSHRKAELSVQKFHIPRPARPPLYRQPDAATIQVRAGHASSVAPGRAAGCIGFTGAIERPFRKAPIRRLKSGRGRRCTAVSGACQSISDEGGDEGHGDQEISGQDHGGREAATRTHRAARY